FRGSARCRAAAAFARGCTRPPCLRADLFAALSLILSFKGAVPRARRSTQWCAADAGSLRSMTVPEQRCTASRCTASGTQSSGQQNGRAGGGTAFQLAMGLLRLFQREFLVDGDLHLSASPDFEELVGGGEQICTRSDVRIERRACGIQRPLRLQDVDVECVNRARCTAKTHEKSERLDAVERGREGSLAYPVVDHLAHFPAGDLFDPRHEIIGAVEDPVMCAALS